MFKEHRSSDEDHFLEDEDTKAWTRRDGRGGQEEVSTYLFFPLMVQTSNVCKNFELRNT